MNNQSIILFDGVCNLCNGAVKFVIKHDPEGKFLFASLQSDAGIKLLQQFGLSADNINSFILLENNKIYTQSTGALKVARQITGWKFIYIFIIIPAFIRDAVYRLIANNRYKWFGKKDVCMIPTPQLQARFLS